LIGTTEGGKASSFAKEASAFVKTLADKTADWGKLKPAGKGVKRKVALGRWLRQEMPMKLKMDCQTIKPGRGGFPGEPSARSVKQTTICDYAGLTRLRLR
jgi:hypothetical protein